MQIRDKTSVDRRIAGAFKAASDATGTSFGYLLSTSGRESDNRPDLGSTTSTAKGLFQFVDQTWLDLVKRQGASVGLDRYAAAITDDGKGNLTVTDQTMRSRILALRSDPLVSSVMAAKFTQENAAKLTDGLGRRPTDGELYAAHVLGAAGAAKLIRLAQNEPTTTAAVAFPRAAAANPALFYDKKGTPQTVSDLFVRLTGPSDAAASQNVRSIASVEANLSSNKTDAVTLARLVAAQAAAVVGSDPLSVADLQKTGNLVGGLTLPGASTGQTTGAGRLDGWRAKASSDAFALLLRSDPAEVGSSEASTGATVSALTEATPGASRVPGATLVAVAEARARARASAPAGGIPYVDPTAPLRLGPTDPTAPTSAAATPVAAAQGEVAYRPSRLMNRAASGAPEMPLPMVDAGRGSLVPARMLFASEAGAEGAIAADAVRVATARISANGSVATSTAAPPMPAAVVAAPPTVGTAPVTVATVTTAPVVPATAAATPAAAPAAATTTAAATPAATTPATVRRGRRPLDLTVGSRARPQDRR